MTSTISSHWTATRSSGAWSESPFSSQIATNTPPWPVWPRVRDRARGYLLQRVETEVAMEMHAAVKMNRLADLRRQTVQQVMAERWLPKTFASGALVRRDFAVIEVSWPKDSAIPAAALSPARQGRTRQPQPSSRHRRSRGQDPGSIRHRIDHGCWAASDLAPLRRTGASSHRRRQGRQFGNRGCRGRSGARCL